MMPLRPTRASLSFSAVCIAGFLSYSNLEAQQINPPKPQVMIVGVAHLQSHRDLHNFDLGDPMSPARQKQIADVAEHLLRFHPTKVMIEAEDKSGIFQSRYEQYLAGGYHLGPNENYQFGFRLARLAGNKSIYPIDVQYAFDYDQLEAYAKSHAQEAIINRANAETVQPFTLRMNQLISTGTMLDILNFLNTEEALRENVGWYLVIDQIGSPTDFPGADLASQWWARNLRIFAKIAAQSQPGDRAVVFIGQGHAAILREFVKSSPDMQFVDPEDFLK